MKLKKLFVLIVLLLAVFLIYLTTMDKKVYYLALGDSIALGNGQTNYSKILVDYLNELDLLEEYRSEFMEDDLRITDLIRNIEDNKKVEVDGKEKTIKNALIKADLVTIAIGNEELFYKMKTESKNVLYDYIDEMMCDMETLLKLMREYCKEDIFVLGYMNPTTNSSNEYIKYANQKLEVLTQKYEVEYVNLELLKNDRENFEGFGLSNLGYRQVANQLISLVERKVIKDEK